MYDEIRLNSYIVTKDCSTLRMLESCLVKPVYVKVVGSSVNTHIEDKKGSIGIIGAIRKSGKVLNKIQLIEEINRIKQNLDDTRFTVGTSVGLTFQIVFPPSTKRLTVQCYDLDCLRWLPDYDEDIILIDRREERHTKQKQLGDSCLDKYGRKIKVGDTVFFSTNTSLDAGKIVKIKGKTRASRVYTQVTVLSFEKNTKIHINTPQRIIKLDNDLMNQVLLLKLKSNTS